MWPQAEIVSSMSNCEAQGQSKKFRHLQRLLILQTAA